MINGVLISQLIGTNVQGEGVVGQASNSTNPGDSFQSVLGGMITASQHSSGSQACPTLPFAAISPQSMNKPTELSSGSMVNSAAQNVPQSILQLLQFLNQASGETHIPLDIIINLQDISHEQLDILKGLGLDISESISTVTAVLNADELEKIKDRVLSGEGELDIPVNAVFDSEGELLSGFSALNATLSMGASVSETGGTSSSNSDEPALTFQLNLFLNQTSASGATEGLNDTELNSNASAENGTVWQSEIISLVEQLRALLAGTTAQVKSLSQNAPSESSILDNNSPAPTDLTAGSEDGIGQTVYGSPLNPENAGENSSSLTAAQGESETGPPAGSEVSGLTVDAVAGLDSAAGLNTLSQEILLVLTDLIGARLEQAVELNDPVKASRILSLLESLSGLEDLPAEARLAAIDSLIQELEAAVPVSSESGAMVEASIVNGGQPGEIESPGSGDKQQGNPGSQGQLNAEKLQVIIRRLSRLSLLISESAARIEIGQTSNSASTGTVGRISVESELRAIADSAEQLSQTIESLVKEPKLDAGNLFGTQAEDPPDNTAQGASRPLAHLTAWLAGMDVSSPSSAGNNAEATAADSPITVNNPGLSTVALDSQPAQGTLPGMDGNNTSSVVNQTVAASDLTSQPKGGDTPSREAVTDTSNIKVKADGQPEVQPGPVGSNVEQAGSRPKTSGSLSGSMNPVADSGKSGNAGEFVNTPSMDKEQLTPAQTRTVEENINRISIPVRLEGLKHAESTARTGETVMVYANQVESGKTDSSNEQVKTVTRAGLENASSTDILNGVIESMQGKGGSMEDRPGNFSQSENLAALKAESLHQGLHSETGNVRPAGAKGEPALQPNSGALFENQPEMIGKITQAARLTSSPGTSEISIRLEPDHLGQMRVRLSVDENHFVSARIQVESQEARSLIESSLQRLRESLAEHGLKVEKFSVDVRQDQNQQQGQNSATADRDNPTRTRRGYFSEDKPAAAELESSFVPEEKTASIRKLGYNTLEWVA